MAESFKLVTIVGPTAVGKSGFALEMAQKFGGCIVNADSVQAYAELNIGTAKPTLQEMQLVPHHLFSYIDAPNKLTAGEYFPVARKKIEECLTGQHVFFVGGSGFYIQAVEKGMYGAGASLPEVQKKFQQILELQGAEELHRQLAEKDPEYAQKISVNDSYRVLRALVLMEQQSGTMTEIQRKFEQRKKQSEWKVPALKLGFQLDRKLLRRRVEARVEQMIQIGLQQEVEKLLASGLKDWHPMASVGYKETMEYLNGKYNASEWRQAIVTATMQLAKRQMTWFRKDASITWIQMPEDAEKAREKIESYLLTS